MIFHPPKGIYALFMTKKFITRTNITVVSARKKDVRGKKKIKFFTTGLALVTH